MQSKRTFTVVGAQELRKLLLVTNTDVHKYLNGPFNQALNQDSTIKFPLFTFNGPHLVEIDI